MCLPFLTLSFRTGSAPRCLSVPAQTSVTRDGPCVLSSAGPCTTPVSRQHVVVCILCSTRLSGWKHSLRSRWFQRVHRSVHCCLGAAPFCTRRLTRVGWARAEKEKAVKMSTGSRPLAAVAHPGTPEGTTRFTPKWWVPWERERWQQVAAERQMSGGPHHRFLSHRRGGPSCSERHSEGNLKPNQSQGLPGQGGGADGGRPAPRTVCSGRTARPEFAVGGPWPNICCLNAHAGQVGPGLRKTFVAS